MDRFPGRFGVLSLIVGPLLFSAGIAFLIGVVDSDTSEQLGNFATSETQATIGFSLLTIAYVLLGFAVMTLAGEVYRSHPRLAAVSGSLAIAALFGLSYFMGITYVERQMAAVRDRESIVAALDSDELFSPVIVLLPICMLGFALLGFAALRAHVLPWWGAVGLAMILLLPAGIIGGIPVIALVGTLGVAAACIPLGLRLWTGSAAATGS